MRAFDFVLLFFSFVYALALTHVLMSAARMIRYRRSISFSLAHGLWMLFALLLVVGNWLSLWDFHRLANIPEGTIAAGFAFSVLTYFCCALVSPEFRNDEPLDLRAFHRAQGPTYIGAALLTVLVALALNFAAGSGLGIQKWSDENALVIAMVVPTVAALWLRAAWVQIAAPFALSVLMITYIFFYYPSLGQ